MRLSNVAVDGSLRGSFNLALWGAHQNGSNPAFIHGMFSAVFFRDFREASALDLFYFSLYLQYLLIIFDVICMEVEYSF